LWRSRRQAGELGYSLLIRASFWAEGWVLKKGLHSSNITAQKLSMNPKRGRGEGGRGEGGAGGEGGE